MRQWCVLFAVLVWLLLATGGGYLAPSSAIAQTTFFSEHLDGLALGPNVDEGRAGINVWIKMVTGGFQAGLTRGGTLCCRW